MLGTGFGEPWGTRNDSRGFYACICRIVAWGTRNDTFVAVVLGAFHLAVAGAPAAAAVGAA